MLFLSSASTKQPVGVLAMSTVFRAGVAALAKTLADEWAPDGIRVNHLIPGRIATDRLTQLDEDAAQRQGVSVEEVRAGIERSIPMGRYGNSLGEIASVVAFLASDDASYITGEVMEVHGGMNAPESIATTVSRI